MKLCYSKTREKYFLTPPPPKKKPKKKQGSRIRTVAICLPARVFVYASSP